MLKQTKIIATISDKRCDVPFLKELFDAGMNVVRLNSAHLDEAGFLKIINNVRQVSPHIAILVDTKGPEIRTTVTEDLIELKTGDKVKIVGDPHGISSMETIYISYPKIAEEMHVDDDILIDDGEIDLKVIEVNKDYLICVAMNDGVVGSRKSVNIPGVRINLPRQRFHCPFGEARGGFHRPFLCTQQGRCVCGAGDSRSAEKYHQDYCQDRKSGRCGQCR